MPLHMPGVGLHFTRAAALVCLHKTAVRQTATPMQAIAVLQQVMDADRKSGALCEKQTNSRVRSNLIHVHTPDARAPSRHPVYGSTRVQP